MATIDFHFDSICPFTWITSRWLIDAAHQEGIEIHWRPMSLAILNDETVEDGGAHQFSRRAQRVFHHLHQQVRHQDAAVLYTAIGESLFPGDTEAAPELLDKLLGDVGLADLVETADDTALDPGVVAEHEWAIGLVGNDVGTPTLVFEDGTAIFGPVVNPAPKGEAAVRLLHFTRELSAMDGFFELKRTRTGDLNFN